MRKKLLYINLLACVATCLQTLWASPDGISSADMSTDPTPYLPFLCLYPVAVFSILLFVFNRFKTRAITQTIIISLLMLLYWLLINYSEFDERVASWSTFAPSEIWHYVIGNSIIPAGTCLLVFAGVLYWMLTKLKPLEDE